MPENAYQTPGNAAAGKLPLVGALYYGSIIQRGQRLYVAIIAEEGDRALCTSATFYGWIKIGEITRNDEE